MIEGQKDITNHKMGFIKTQRSFVFIASTTQPNNVKLVTYKTWNTR